MTWPRWMDLKQASKYANMSEPTMLKFVTAGKIVGNKRGGKWYIDSLSIDEFLSDDSEVNLVVDRIQRKLQYGRHGGPLVQERA